MFTHATELSEAELADWLRRQRETDPEIAAEVEALLAADGADCDEFFSRPLVELDAEGTPEAGGAVAGTAIASVGAYRITGRIGQGGMGEVYRGVHGPTGREAAIKLPRGERGTRRAIERLRLEAETLGRLNEPRIAQLFDAGIAEILLADGTRGHRPFIAMEYVEGPSITEYARARGLDTTARLELMESVARAVQHAHQRGVIHRDLKPGNILVSPGTGGGPATPKIVDFGIAKLIDESGAGSNLTVTGQILGTVKYMSPEQASGASTGVDTRADIYSVGAVLYELLAERPVIESPSGSALVLVGQVLSQRPPRLATLRPEFRGDIDAVVHKAIERDPKDRYQSAGDLADDLARLVRREPVIARAPTTVERIVRAARRNKPLTAATALAVLAMVGGTVVSVRMAYLAEKRAAEAIRQADRVRSARTGWNKAISSVQQVVTATAAESNDFRTLVLRNMEKALERDESVPGRSAVDRVYAIEAVTHLFEPLGEPAKALRWHSRALAVLEEAGQPEDSLLLTQRAMVAALRLKVDPKADVAECEQVIADSRRKLAAEVGESEPMMLRLAQIHASALGRLGRFEESERVYRRLIDVLSAAESEPDVLAHVQGLLGVSYRRAGRASEAVPLLRNAIEGKTALGASDIELAIWHDNYANALSQLLDHEQALGVYQRMYELETRALGPQHGKTAETAGKLARCLFRLGRADEAAELAEKSVTVLRSQRPAFEQQLILALNTACSIRTVRGELDTAEALLAEARDAFTARGQPAKGFVWQHLELSAAMLKRRRGDLDGAESALLALHSTAKGDAEPWPPLLSEIASELAALYAQRGDSTASARWQARVRP